MNIILEPLRSLFELIYNITGDWGVAIILLTIAVRILVMPFTLKSRIAMKGQSELSEKINELKKKYAHDKKKLEAEMMKYQGEMKQSMSGCMGLIVQAPLLMAMFNLVKTIPVDVSSVLVPWAAAISMPDKLFILPVLYIIVLSLPSLLCNFQFFKVLLNRTFNKGQLLMNIAFGVILTVKAPIALGIYFIAGGVTTFIEEIIVSIIYKRKLSKS